MHETTGALPDNRRRSTDRYRHLWSQLARGRRHTAPAGRGAPSCCTSHPVRPDCKCPIVRGGRPISKRRYWPLKLTSICSSQRRPSKQAAGCDLFAWNSGPQRGRRGTGVVLSALRFGLRLRTLPDPTEAAGVVAVREGIRRTHGAPAEQAAPLMPRSSSMSSKRANLRDMAHSRPPTRAGPRRRPRQGLITHRFHRGLEALRTRRARLRAHQRPPPRPGRHDPPFLQRALGQLPSALATLAPRSGSTWRQYSPTRDATSGLRPGPWLA